jgi:hypothetical protein
VPRDCDRHVAQIGQRLHTRIPSHHDRASAYRGVEPDDLASAQLLHALDSAPFAHRVDFKRALLELRLLPSVREVLDPAFVALGIVLMIDDIESFFGKEALLQRNPPGSVMGVAIALDPNGARHGNLPC